jgi:hypothetical protein
MNAAELEPVFGADSHPDAVRALEDHHELMRRVSVLTLQNRRPQDIEPGALRAAQFWASIPPLDRPLGSGDPL